MLSKFEHQRLFSRSCHTHFKTQQSSNDYISSLCKQNLFKQALHAFDFVRNNTRFCISLSTYARLLLASSSLKSLEHGRRVHDHLLGSNSRADVVLHNHILNMYGKCGSLADARKVFDGMPERNVVSWTSMIAGYSQKHQEEEAVRFYFGMRRSGLVPDQFTFGSMIRACSGMVDVELGRQLHGHVVKSEFGTDSIVQNALIAMYSKFDRIDDAVGVFERIEMKDLISWGSMISGFAQQGCELEALSLFKEMLELGVYFPNEFVFGSVFSACSGLLQLEHGKQTHGLSIKFGLGRDCFAGCSLSDMYAKCGCLDSARKAFGQVHMPDLVSWNAIIAGFSYEDDINEAMLLFSQMRDSGLKPDQITVRCLLCACTSYATLSQGQQIHSYIVKMGLDLDVPVCNTLLTMYAKCSDLSDAFKAFEEIKSGRDSVSWNAILTSCMQHDHMDNVLRLIRLMHCSENKLDQITISNALGACAHLATLEMGNQVHGCAVKMGLEVDLSVANGLIDMYAKCGSLEDAQKLFKLMSNPDVISWSSLIVGYAHFGYGNEALELFSDMRHLGIKPNHVTFVGVLSACSRVGLVDEGFRYYKAMVAEHGIVPTREHCSCMVDLLARAGRLREAERFINQMPFDPDIVVWKTLLSACRTHGDVELGKRAAENILKLDPSNSAAHVLLCNIYALKGYWDDAARLRKLMKSRGVRKHPGQSWIEIRDKVHVFLVEDKSHPEANEIYGMLGELRLQMREAGYIPTQKISFERLLA
ncbi:pentatricopeptide repeat-containing protein At3g53360, mitochondrial [Magnolia sinica]|uniref:pentatricopeptide repeat-containing protein At3g53360, mitochondrial n=1 Tax=Magnolia sinica TaxID=86752 RepID=UPI00265B4195|nr:pentatricopeptide repeat-containing protein At3g53360, mitochondrial [Magnolia sinica]XP_058100356.1 pentatricopeptide repeat-containing protein At3g53360, mitochondrial [Magnolia sinica]XP_058100357.1 pentatricopeptide repeat-containing protein At3g53360, mitochondrial [Magnolia sinica]XP_058100358.1 pentatricopeptide repeat-containing protein At3g53360, mitochondrial [Magnolia sinica]XP_058100359.1 pentatricopeptide repeat-containing protein At3g53360, mitochondrial [Magnolia sinica]